MNKNYTSVEQSKILMELGLPVESSDMYYYAANKHYGWKTPVVKTEDNHLGEDCMPCWSTGRLIEILKTQHPHTMHDDGSYEDCCLVIYDDSMYFSPHWLYEQDLTKQSLLDASVNMLIKMLTPDTRYVKPYIDFDFSKLK